MTDQQLDLDEGHGRTAWLLRITTDQIKHYSFETICDWLIARHDQRIARLRAACQTLREQNDRQARAHARIAAALAAAPVVRSAAD
ncbi:hypothetical protein [Streptomyces capoamus]|uniref:hypothetical protein n=1 Tax=Streptomyces capoamus TaxID=68183 RepID=UPI0033931B0E